jgi:thiol-disulfide isomerase/thioredoxin
MKIALMDRLKKIRVLLFLVAVCLLAVSCKKAEETVVVESGKAPVFTFTGLKGEALPLLELRGKVVIVEFWATWCPPCREAIPELNKVFEKFQGRSVQLLGIAVDKGGDAASRVSAVVKEDAVVYPVMLDSGRVSVAYGVSGIPALFIIDKEGKVAKRHMGFSPGLAETISKEVEELL